MLRPIGGILRRIPLESPRTRRIYANDALSQWTTSGSCGGSLCLETILSPTLRNRMPMGDSPVPRMPVHPPVPVPRGWPGRVRSAVVHAISLATASMTSARGWAADSWNPRVRMKEENVGLRGEIALLREELRLKDARMARIPAQRRPHYPPAERLAILELRAARGWSLTRTPERLLVTPLTVSHWMRRLDEEGPDALVQIPKPVNRFPEFVGYLVRRLKTLCPTMGRVRTARVLARAGLHLAPTTIRRMLRAPRPPAPHRAPEPEARRITARKPNDLWHLDLTTVPTALGF